MHRTSIHRWIAALALVAVLGVMGAQPAAASELSGLDRLAGLWSAITERPGALWDSLLGWFDGNDKPSLQKEDNGMGIDPLGDPVAASSSSPTGDGAK